MPNMVKVTNLVEGDTIRLDNGQLARIDSVRMRPGGRDLFITIIETGEQHEAILPPFAEYELVKEAPKALKPVIEYRVMVSNLLGTDLLKYGQVTTDLEEAQRRLSCIQPGRGRLESRTVTPWRAV